MRETSTSPRIEIVSYVEPDGGVEQRVFVDGIEVEEGVEETCVDPGRGHTLPELRESRFAAVREASLNAAAAIAAFYDRAENSKWVLP